MSDKFAATVQAYNQHAARFVQYFEKKLDATELDKFIGLMPQGGYVLDAGCGSGRDAAYLMSRGLQVLGIDLSEGMLAEAKNQHPEVSTQVMSLTDISLADDAFDGIWCKASLLHLDRAQVPAVLSSFHRILKDQGILFIHTKAGQGEAEQPVAFDATISRHFTFYDLAEICQLLEQAGFAVIEKYVFNGQARYATSREQDWLVVFARQK